MPLCGDKIRSNPQSSVHFPLFYTVTERCILGKPSVTQIIHLWNTRKSAKT